MSTYPGGGLAYVQVGHNALVAGLIDMALRPILGVADVSKEVFARCVGGQQKQIVLGYCERK